MLWPPCDGSYTLLLFPTSRPLSLPIPSASFPPLAPGLDVFSEKPHQITLFKVGAPLLSHSILFIFLSLSIFYWFLGLLFFPPLKVSSWGAGIFPSLLAATSPVCRQRLPFAKGSVTGCWMDRYWYEEKMEGKIGPDTR